MFEKGNSYCIKTVKVSNFYKKIKQEKVFITKEPPLKT